MGQSNPFFWSTLQMEQSTRAQQGQNTTPVPRHCEPEEQRQRSRTTAAARPWVPRSLQHPGSVPTAALQTNPVLQRSRAWVPPAPSGPALFLQPAAAPDTRSTHIQSRQAARCLGSFSLVPLSPAWCSLGVPTLRQVALRTEPPDPPLSLCFTRRDEHIPDTSPQRRL